MAHHPRRSIDRVLVLLHGVVLATCCVAIASCTTGQQSRGNPVNWGDGIGPGKVTPVQVQSRIMSFADNYIGFVGGAVDSIQPTLETARERAFVTEAAVESFQNVVTIASSGNPVVGFLDMRVLVSLQKRALEEWRVNGLRDDRYAPITRALAALERDLVEFEEQLLSPEMSEQVDRLVEVVLERDGASARLDWLRASELAESRQQLFVQVEGGGNLLSLFYLDPLANLNPAAREIAQSRLLAERSVFYAMRLPTIARWQAEALALKIAAMEETQTVVTTVQQIGETVGASERVLEDTADSIRVVSDAVGRTADTIATFESSIDESLASAIDRSMNGIAREREAAFGQLETERAAAVDQVFDGVAREREALLVALRDEDDALRTTIGEVRQTLEATERLSDSLERSSESVRKLVAAMPAPAEPDPNAPGVDDYRALLESTARTATELRGLLETVDPMLDPDAIDASTARFAEVGRWSEALVDRVFQRALVLVGVTAFAAILVGVVLRFVWKR